MTEPEPIPVHIASDATRAPGGGKRKRRALALRTLVLTAADPVQTLLQQNAYRLEANVQPKTNDIAIYLTKGDAQSGGGGGATIPAANNEPYPLNTTDHVYVTAAVLPTTVYVTQILEAED